MSYQRKNHSRDVFVSLYRLQHGFESFHEAAGFTALRREIYGGVCNLLHEKAISERMEAKRNVATDAGLDEETWEFYEFSRTALIRYYSRDVTKLREWERRLESLQRAVDERARSYMNGAVVNGNGNSSQDGPVVSGHENPARNGYQGLPETLRNFQCVADFILRQFDDQYTNMDLQKQLLELEDELHSAPADHQQTGQQQVGIGYPMPHGLMYEDDPQEHSYNGHMNGFSHDHENGLQQNGTHLAAQPAPAAGIGPGGEPPSQPEPGSEQ